MAKYTKKMPEKLLAAMSKGHSFKGACGVLGISSRTGYNWVEKYKAFADAKDTGDMMALRFLESAAINALMGLVPDSIKEMGGKKLNVTMIIFLLKTRFHEIYSDKQKIEYTKSDPFIIEGFNGESVKLGVKEKDK